MGVEQGPSKPDPELFIQACLALGVFSFHLMVGILPVIFRWRVRLGQQVVSASAGESSGSPFTGSGCDRPTRRNPNWEI